MSVAPAMTRALLSVSNPSASSRSEGRAYMRAAHASDVCMQMIERNRRLVKDRRMLGVAYQTAWFMEHRIREAMRDGALSPMGGGGGVVEIDETYIGRKDGFEVKQGAWHKNTILTLVERDGRARSFHVDNATKENIVPIIRANIDRESHVMTDEASRYSKIGTEFAKHDVVDHSRKEYGYTTARLARRST